MVTFKSDPMKTWAYGVELAALLVQAQSTIAIRMMGTADVWSHAPEDNRRVVSEKIYALSKAARDASVVAMTGAGPEAAMEAAIRPLRQKTRANSRRTSKSKLPSGQK